MVQSVRERQIRNDGGNKERKKEMKGVNRRNRHSGGHSPRIAKLRVNGCVGNERPAVVRKYADNEAHRSERQADC